MLIPVARRIIGLLPASAGYQTARFLAERPYTAKLKARDIETLKSASHSKVKSGKHLIDVWQWGAGPSVIFVHGWGGRGVQLASMAKKVAEYGFKAVIFDARGHGDKGPNTATFATLLEDIITVSASLNEPVHAYVGHSAGGLCMMAARYRDQISAKTYVCLSSPKAPYVPLNEIKKLLNPSETIMQRLEDYYANQFGLSMKELNDAVCYSLPEKDRLLLVFDENDDRVKPDDAKVICKQWAGANTVKTQGLGHMKVLWQSDIIDKVSKFISDRAAN